jgi:hypothetical protein
MRTPLAPAMIALATLGALPAAQAGDALPIDGRVVHLGTYDLATGAIRPGAPPASSPGAEAPVLDFDNTAASGFFFLPGAGVGAVDWGVYAPSGPGTLYDLTVGYATHAPGTIAMTVLLYAGTGGHCASGDPGTALASFPLSGLPGSPDGIQTVSHTLTISTRKSGIVVPPGPLGWEYRFFDVASGPLLVDGPAGLPAPNGTEDALDLVDLGGGACSTKSFGCLPPFLACASTYLALSADDGSTPWSVAAYGSGVNPPGSLSVLGGQATIGATLVLGVDNPLGTQTVGSNAFVAISHLPDPNFPAGTLFGGFGMSGPAGEILISLVPPSPFLPVLGPSIWSGPGFPATIPLSIPQNANFIGVHVYVQGLLVDLSPGSTVPFGLTDALDVGIGF